MRTRVLIAGGGLSGLHTAYELGKRGIDYLLVEARERFGGRILSQNAGSTDYRSDEPAFDLGPSWFWPGQVHIQTLIPELGLAGDVFTQYGSGDSLFEDERAVHRGVPGISMAGAYRLKGGIRQLVATLEERLEKRRLLAGAVVQEFVYHDDGLSAAVLQDGNRRDVQCDAVVIAMPPRLAAQTIAFNPPLSEKRQNELTEVPTWMAGHAKLVAVYKEPFWREQGLSGDVVSYRGPLGEIHDASAAEGGPYALFGFLNVPAGQRDGKEQAIKQAAIEQLSRLFGRDAESPLKITMKDWARERYTATELDQPSSNQHVFSRMQEFAEQEWGKRLIWSGSELAGGHIGGYLEGAIYSSVRTVGMIDSA